MNKTQELSLKLQVVGKFGTTFADQMADDLITWLNVVEPSKRDLNRLASLAVKGQFDAWDCPTCGKRVMLGNPDDWSYFQGTCQPDYTSYPLGNTRQCDHCRLHHPDPTAE